MIGAPGDADYGQSAGAAYVFDLNSGEELDKLVRETDADYLGLYLAERGGFDIGVAAGFWRRWTLLSPFMLHDRKRASHPASTSTPPIRR